MAGYRAAGGRLYAALRRRVGHRRRRRRRLMRMEPSLVGRLFKRKAVGCRWDFSSTGDFPAQGLKSPVSP